MAEDSPKSSEQTGPARTKDEVSLEMMKFIAVQTGYGKGNAAGAGFSGKQSVRTAEEYAEALLELFRRCRDVVGK